MYTDNGLRLATAEVTPNGGASPGGLGAASVTLGLDLSGTTQNLRTFLDPGDGKQLGLNINVTTGVTCGTFGATLELQLVSIPIVATLLSNATTSGKTLTITGVVTDSTADTFTINGHGLPLGTPFFITALATTTGISNSTLYYAVPTTANAFKAATSLANAVAGTTIDLLTGNGTATVNFIPTIHATTGSLPIWNAGVPTNQGPLSVAGARVFAPMLPMSFLTGGQYLPTGQTLTQPLGSTPVTTAATGIVGGGGPATVANRYFYLRYLPSATITAGAFTIDIVENAGIGALKAYPSGMTI